MSPSITSGEERECRKDDFESIASTSIGAGGFGKVFKVRHKVSKNVFAIKVINKAKILEHDLVDEFLNENELYYIKKIEDKEFCYIEIDTERTDMSLFYTYNDLQLSSSFFISLLTLKIFNPLSKSSLLIFFL